MLDRMRKRSVSMPGLDALGYAEFKGVGLWNEPTAPPHLKPPMSSISSSLLPPNETRLLATAEGCWSGRVKRTGENSLWGESEVSGVQPM